MSNLADLMKKKGGGVASASRSTSPAAAKVERDESLPTPSAVAEPIQKDDFLPGLFDGLEIEAVVAGVLMKVRFTAGVTPASAVESLRRADPGAKFRDDFPSKGAFGKRETKTARALVLNADVRDSGKFISITVTSGSDDLSVSVGKKIADEWLGKVEALGKLTDRNVEKLRAAFENKKPATIVLGEAEQFGVRYWTTDDGKAFLDDMEAEPPALAEGGAE